MPGAVENAKYLAEFAQCSFTSDLNGCECQDYRIRQKDGVIHAMTWGKSSLPPLLCLHGGGQSLLEFSVLGPLLADNFFIIAASYGGHGETSWNFKQSKGFIKSQLKSVLEFFEVIDGILFGSSLGGLHGAHLAKHSQTRIAKLILGDILPSLRTDSLSKAMEFYRKLSSGEVTNQTDFDNLSRSIARSEFGREYSLHLQRFHSTSVTGEYISQTDPSLPDFINNRSFSNFWDDFDNIDCPVLLLRPPPKHSLISESSLARFIKHTKILSIQDIPDSGHNLVIDNPFEVAKNIRNFVRQY